MILYETLNFVVDSLTLGVLFWHLRVLQEYAGDTKTLARTAMEQLPRPYLVVKQVPDTGDLAVLGDTTVSLGDQHSLCFENLGTARAVNARYFVRATGDPEQAAVQLADISPGETFDSRHPVNLLPGEVVVIIQYESIAGSRYRTEQTIEEGKWVRKSAYHRWNWPQRSTIAR